MKEILFVVAYVGLWIVSYLLASIAIDHQVRLEYLEEQQDRKEGRTAPKEPRKGSFLFGLIRAEEILEPPIPLEPCKLCGGTDVLLTYCKIFWFKRWLVYCIPCRKASFIKKDPHSACIEWNSNLPVD